MQKKISSKTFKKVRDKIFQSNLNESSPKKETNEKPFAHIFLFTALMKSSPDRRQCLLLLFSYCANVFF